MSRPSPRISVACLVASPQLAALPHDVRAELEAMCRRKSYPRMTTVVHAGEKTDFVGFVRHGILRMQKTLADGRQHIVGILFEGDMIGRVLDGPLAFDVEAAVDTELCLLPRGPFEALMAKSPDLDRMVFLSTLTELDRARDWLLILAQPRITSRLAGFLLLMCARFTHTGSVRSDGNGSLDVAIPISRVDLAHLLGTRHESISRALHALADGGSIAVKRPDLIEIRDIDALIEQAGDDIGDNQDGLREMMRRARDGR